MHCRSICTLMHGRILVSVYTSKKTLQQSNRCASTADGLQLSIAPFLARLRATTTSSPSASEAIIDTTAIREATNTAVPKRYRLYKYLPIRNLCESQL